MDWKKCARGVFLDGDQAGSVEKLKPYGVLIAKLGSAFNANVQTAYECGRPVVVFAEHQILKWHVECGLDKAKWPLPAQEPLIQAIDHAILSGGAKIAVHGIMLDCSSTKNELGETLTSTWYTERTDWMLNMVYKRYGLPIYLYMNKNPINTYKGQAGEQGVIQLMAKHGVCTVSLVSNLDDGYPFPLVYPSLPYNDTSLVRWNFWLYDLTEDWRFLYNGSLAELYKELNYVARPEQAPTPTQPVPQTLEEKVDRLLVLMEKVAKHFVD